LNGRIPLILDGGDCGVGVESTVVDFTSGVPAILRPGGFSKERLEEILKTEVSLYVKPENAPPRSPGLKYKHYSPRCKLIAVQCAGNDINSLKKVYDIQVQKGGKPAIMYLEERGSLMGNRAFISLGSTPEQAAKSFFKVLRENEDKYDALICGVLPQQGLGRAFNDRLLRAAAEITEVKSNK